MQTIKRLKFSQLQFITGLFNDMALFEYLWLLHGRYQKCHWQIYNAPSLFVSLFYVWIKIKKMFTTSFNIFSEENNFKLPQMSSKLLH